MGSAREGKGSAGEPAAAPAAGLGPGQAPTVLQRRAAAGAPVEPDAATGVDPALLRAVTLSATDGGATPASVPALTSSPSTPFRVDDLRFASAEDALLDDEVRRSRLLSRFGSLMYAAALIAVPLFPSAPPMTVVGPASLGLGFAASFWLRYLAQSPSRYRPRQVTAMWTLNSLALAGGVAYVGVFSPAAVAIAIATYWLGLGISLARAVIAYVVAAGSHAAVAALVIAGAIEDPGFLALRIVDPQVLAVCELLLQLILASAFITARLSRKATLSAVRNYEQVARALGQRDALLQEARADLERALQLGGIGRFSGQQLGSYRLGAVIGRGGMGEVYDATHVVTGQAAAVKLLQPQGLASPGAVLRFLREAQLASSLSVPQIVRVFEVGDASATVPYLAMERLRGSDLAELLRSRRLSLDEVVDLIDQVGRGVDAATAAGVVHRDLKPQNLFLADDPPPRGWRILDFGLSKMVGEGSELTQNRLLGTPIYMAPEQAQGLPVDHRADLYSLAAVAYRCLTGTPPVGNGSFAAVVHAVINLMPVRPGALAELPADIDSALQIGLAKAPADRYASAAELTAALRDATRGHLPSPLRDRAASLAAAHPWRVRW